MNDYRQRLGLNRQFEPSTTSMGKFFSNRLRDSLHIGGALTTNERENFDHTLPDKEATPEPPMSIYDVNRSIITPIPSTNESYFTQTTPDIHKFSRRVELSSGYNILKNRTSSRPTRLPAQLQGRAPLAQLNPLLPTTTTTTTTAAAAALTVNNSSDHRQRRLSFTDHNRTQQLAYHQHILQQYNTDGTRRPFSSDSPIPSVPVPPPSHSSTILTSHYISSAPPLHNRTVYQPIEPLKLATEQEDNSIAELSRELRAAAYPTTHKSSNHSPTRETSPSTTRHTSRLNSKRVPPRSLPKIHTNDQQTSVHTAKVVHHFHHSHHHEPEKHTATTTTTTTEDRLQNSSSASMLLDQFFNSEQTHETVPINNEKQVREQPSVALLRTSSSSNPTEDTTLLFVSKFARLAPIVPTHPTNGNTSILSSDENNNSLNRSFHIDMNAHEQTFDTLHGLSGFHDENVTITDDLFPTGDMTHTSDAIDEGNEIFSYVPLKEQRTRMDNVPLLELDELETNSDISESQLVPIIYAKELANEIELLQRAHSLKQQQRSMSTNHENDRINDNNSVPPPANMELLNFEALDEEFSVLHHHSEDSPLSSPRIPSTMMEVSSSPIPTKPISSPLVTETETPKTSILQHGILAHNRLSPWFKLPTELWFKILPYLTTNELRNFSYVCKRFYLLAQDQACQHKIIFTRRMQLDQLWFDVIARRKPISLTFIEGRQQNSENTLQSIESDANRIKWNEFFQTIGSNLFEFTMSGFYHEPFTPNTFLPLIVQTCSNLLSLNLRWNHITESTLNHLINYPQFIHLQTLDLTGCQTLDDTLLINIFIRTETEFHLKKLILHACTNITWISLDTIAICIPTLVHLNISRCIGFKNLSTNSNSTCFHYWSKLEYINFDHLLTITDNDLTIVFDHCKYLHTLIFDDCMNITDQTLHHLTTNFRMISLNNCTNLSTDVLANLNEQCPQLEIVNFNSINNFNDNCLLKWSEKPLMKLQRLSLDNCKQCSLNSIDKFLTKHVNLRELSITGDIVSNLIERKILQEKFPYIKFVFQ